MSNLPAGFIVFLILGIPTLIWGIVRTRKLILEHKNRAKEEPKEN